MNDPMETVQLMQVKQDLQMQAKTITEIVQSQRQTNDFITEMQRNEAVRVNNEKHLDDRLIQIEEKINGIYKLGLWILAAFGSSAVSLGVTFLFRGN